MTFLQSHGVGPGYAARIVKHYGERAIAGVRENPYRLATDIFGIGFLSADKIAAKLGFARDSALRAEAGILYVLQEQTDEGHVYYPLEALIAKGQEILAIEKGVIAQAGAHRRGARIFIEAGGGSREGGKRSIWPAYHHP
jgi:exodeoxyribonuclease V alpha subunit